MSSADDLTEAQKSMYAKAFKKYADGPKLRAKKLSVVRMLCSVCLHRNNARLRERNIRHSRITEISRVLNVDVRTRTNEYLSLAHMSYCQFRLRSSLYRSSMITIGTWMYCGSSDPSSSRLGSHPSNVCVM